MLSIDTVLFDLNGVLILDNPSYKTNDLETVIFKRMGTSLDDLTEKESIKKELGWDEDTFWNFIDTGWKGAIPNLQLISLIKHLKKCGFKTGIISNTSGLIMRKKLDNYFNVPLNTLFDVVIISSEVKLLKPDINIFKLTLNKLQSLPGGTVFIDDSLRYMHEAKDFGINCIQFKTNEDLFLELSRIINLSSLETKV